MEKAKRLRSGLQLKKQLLELLFVFLREVCELDPHPLLVGVTYGTFRLKRNSGARHPQNQARAGWQPVICAEEHPAEADHSRDALEHISILAPGNTNPETLGHHNALISAQFDSFDRFFAHCSPLFKLSGAKTIEGPKVLGLVMA
jgi:hypothetical protein